MYRINVICGGNSDEREISLRSGAAVAHALEQAGYDVQTLDTDAPLSQITRCDVVFPVLHGTGGEDGSLQKSLETAGVPFVGSGSLGSARCFDKFAYRTLLIEHGLPVASGELVDYTSYTTSQLSRQPHVLKPFDGGSSIDTFIVRDVDDKSSESAILDSFGRHPHMLLEELVVGTEITVGILGERALPIIEIIPPESGEFDYENKYNGKSQELCPPVHVPAAAQQAARQLALQIHQLTGCRDVSRTDMIVTANDELYVLETNTIPGMTEQSLFPKMAATAGISMPELVDQLIKMSLSR